MNPHLLPLIAFLNAKNLSMEEIRFAGICALILFINSLGNSGTLHHTATLDKINADSVKTISISDDCNPGHILNNDTNVCSGSIIKLKSRQALTYKWTPETGLNNATIQNPFALIEHTLTYQLETSDYMNNLVTNPDFELGNTGFTTSYTYCDGINCLKPLGDNGYSIGTDASYFHSYFLGKDHTSGSGNFMIVNGAQPSLVVWEQTIAVKPHTSYAFGVWISTMISLSPAQIKFSINGVQVGSLYNAPQNAYNWEQVFAIWNSGSATSATIQIVDILPILEGNDFGLDDFFFGEITTCTDSVIVTDSQNVKLGNDTILSLEQPFDLAPITGNFEHYTWNTGETSPSISVNKTGKYWVSVTDINGCISVDTLFVQDSRVFMVFPDAFTPNNDKVNDFFRPVFSNIIYFHLTIFNRWGQILFETNAIETGWDGMLKGGLCPAEQYLYMATYKQYEASDTKTMRGSFRLIR